MVPELRKSSSEVMRIDEIFVRIRMRMRIRITYYLLLSEGTSFFKDKKS